MSGTLHALAVVAVVAAVTALLRFLPFALFARRTPRAVLYLGQALPYAVMAMLVVYCLRGTSFAAPAHGLPEIAAVALVAALHLWRHNTLLSILGGTVCYMFLVQVVFAGV